MEPEPIGRSTGTGWFKLAPLTSAVLEPLLPLHFGGRDQSASDASCSAFSRYIADGARTQSALYADGLETPMICYITELSRYPLLHHDDICQKAHGLIVRPMV